MKWSIVLFALLLVSQSLVVSQTFNQMNQPPDPTGWAIGAMFSEYFADDWVCDESGDVTGITWWGAWLQDVEGVLFGFNISIWDELPSVEADEPVWQRYFDISSIQITSETPSLQNYLLCQGGIDVHEEPTMDFIPFHDDHMNFSRYEILNIADAFYQEEGNTYWLQITPDVEFDEMIGITEFWGWKTSTVQQNKSAVVGFFDRGEYYWFNLSDPDTFQPLDFAFVLTVDTFIEPPVFSNELPVNNSMNVSKTQANVRVHISTTELFNWSIEGKHVNNQYGTNAESGTKSASLITPLPYLTEITWYVNVSTASYNINKIYRFISEAEFGGENLQEIIDNAQWFDKIVLPPNTYVENIIIDKPITLEGVNPATTIIDGGGLGHVITINSDFVTISGLTIINSGSAGIYATSDFFEIYNCILSDNKYSIWVDSAEDGVIRNNFIQKSENGIRITDSSEIQVYDNNISGKHNPTPPPSGVEGCTYGLVMSGSIDCKIFENTLSYNDRAIILSYCLYSTITKNNIFRNYNNAHSGIVSDNGAYNIISYNDIWANGGNFGAGHAIFLEGEVGTLISNNEIYANMGNGISVFGKAITDPNFSDRIMIGGNNIYDNGISGIGLWHTADNRVFRNTLSGNGNGILIVAPSKGNRIYQNELDGNMRGVWINTIPGYDAVNNRVYHNNFYTNIEYEIRDTNPEGSNRWNDTYPSGGNFYYIFHNDSHGAYDNYRGHYQTIPGQDGIVDGGSLNPFIGLGSARDYYPLRDPWSAVELLTTDFTWSPGFPNPKTLITFTASVDANEYHWSFADGSKATGKTVTHKYESVGTYAVSLRTVNDRGYQDIAINRVHVVPTGPFIPPLEPAKYPGFTMEEMYYLLRTNELKGSKNEVTIMVIDSGILPSTYNDFDLSYIESQYATGLPDGIDTNGHGTWCNYAVGYVVKQKLSNVNQISYRIFGATGETTNEMLLEALDEAKRQKVDVVSFSGGAIGHPNDVFSQKVKELRDEGIFVVSASGNFGPYASTILSPACSDYAFSVSASDPQWYGEAMTAARRVGVLNRADDEICLFSSCGPVEGVYPKPDAVAPGESILGPWVSRGAIVEKAASGTSMATPLVAAGATIVIAENKELIERVKSVRFWDKGVVVIALEEAIRENCFEKGGVNAWGAGIVDWTEVSTSYEAKLNEILLMSILTVWVVPILLIIAVIVLAWYLLSKRKGTLSPFGRKKKPWWVK